MTRSALSTGTTAHGGKYNAPRERPVDMFIVHHAATTSLAGLRQMFAQDGGRGTSANYIVGNAGEILAAVPEEYRAWTSGGKRDGATVDGARYDHRAITVETVNQTGAPGWTISPAAFEALARLIEDCARRYSFPLDRDHVIGHGELLTRFHASYATACPGGISVDALVHRARAIRTNREDDDDMPTPREVAEAVWQYPMDGGAKTADGTVGRESAGARLREVRRSTINLQKRTITLKAETAALKAAVATLATTKSVTLAQITTAVEKAVRDALADVGGDDA